MSGRAATATTVKLATIGDEAAPQARVIDALESAGVELVIDVRAVASSRRAGFSKTLLAASLAQAGIAYVHLRQLGTPKAGREAARAGRIGEMREIFEAHLAEPAAQVELAQAVELSALRPAALLCYEADAARCHRSIVSDRIAQARACEVEHLTP